MASKALSVSAIIPTKDRPSDLELAIQSLLRQTRAPQQVIIVDQSMSDDGFLRAARQYEAAPSRLRDATKLHYIRDVEITSSAAARNRAMEMAEGDIWLFLDDDVELEPEFLEELLAVYNRYPQVHGVSGIITNYEPPSWAFRLWACIFARGPFHDERQSIYWKADRLRDVRPIPVSKFGAGLMSFRAEVIRELRFEPYLRGVSTGEDVDFCSRLGPGVNMVMAPRARLVHKQNPIGRAHHHWLQRSARAHHYLYRRHWRTGAVNRVCFLWLNVGLAVAAFLASLRHLSLTPLRAFRDGITEGRKAA